ncbi:hypothetical protein EVAR_53228_1 [Eumeta japonica]|uniref:Uncharacterized protein n=1 Tax=Eumeta variegata TaxID=151549 RepID=A0A4C1XDP0_EUMVA|nr:hypothetical protein EVAR_53228_1 [Eumeta japonica]
MLQTVDDVSAVRCGDVWRGVCAARFYNEIQMLLYKSEPKMLKSANKRPEHGQTRVGCVRPLSLFYSDASADAVVERSLVPRSYSHARLRRNATMSYVFSCVQPAFIDL